MVRRRTYGTGNDEEQFADAFAAALLMPRREFKKAWRREKSVVILSAIFKVPVEAVQYRMRQLRMRP